MKPPAKLSLRDSRISTNLNQCAVRGNMVEIQTDFPEWNMGSVKSPSRFPLRDPRTLTNQNTDSTKNREPNRYLTTNNRNGFLSLLQILLTLPKYV